MRGSRVEVGGGGQAEQTYSQLPVDLNKTHKSQARRDKHTHKYCYVMRQQDPVSGRGPLPLALNV